MTTGTWLNSDGLLIVYGTGEALGATGGTYEDTVTGSLIMDYLIPLTALSTATPVYGNIANQTNIATAGFVTRSFFPSNFLLEKVELYVEQTATTSTSATLNVGFWDITTNTVISATGAIAGATAAAMVVGTWLPLTVGSTYAGAKLGLVVYNGGSVIVPHQIGITAQTSTGTFTAGTVRVRLWGRRSLWNDTSSSVDD